ncbi:hypothetical protein BOKEGFJH_00851 [Chlamydia avium]|uniref:Uncharacterized protein n=2 Tax=Chlamydia avium TaxID=1457141 RepID=A0ABN0MTK4_9CHLA|nr:hypothetical protein CP10881SC42_0307 [Chlamydia avium]VVT43308.1 hypothetical protein BOKEGFJH_00851 [Chlamydia avium]
MRKIIFVFASMFLLPLAIEENKESFSLDAKNEKKILQIYGQEVEFSFQEIIDPILDLRDSLGRV